MTFSLEIETDNAAFTDDPAAELGRILRELVDGWAGEGIGRPDDSGRLYDVNGNRVGSWSYVAPEPDGAPAGYRLATRGELHHWLNGHVSYPGAIEEDGGLYLPVDR